ncbi:hypothetical protein [Azospirillum sp. TSO35-2]|nr:hypothetical protein [Azospirillum sp. TSO35-2]
MADELKSFKRDWQRWSSAEKLTAVSALIVIATLLGVPAASLF